MKEIIKKSIFYIAFSLAISLLYMNFLSQSYMTLSWPLSFLAFIFFGIAWFRYLRNDDFKIKFRFRKSPRKKVKKHKSMIDYTDTSIKHMKDYTEKEIYQIQQFSNIITGVILLILSFLFR